MFDYIFENRNKKLVNLIKLGDCIGRSLRENVEIFKISDSAEYVSYITEGNKVISGNYHLEDHIELTNLVIEDSTLYMDDSKFDQHVQDRVSDFVRSLYEDKFGEAETNFSDVLDSWNDRIRFERTQKTLNQKISRFTESNEIVTTPEFMRFIEIAPQVLDFLKENRDEIIEIPEIKNAVKLSNVVTRAFDLPRINYETLQEEGSYTLKDVDDNSIYEMICKQELVKKDLLESKKQFDESWATHDKVRNLAGLIYEDETSVSEHLADVIEEVPYFAFISKKQISNTIRNALSLVENQVQLPEKDLQRFVATIFEMKKEVKSELTYILSEKYGVNIQNLKDTPSFKSLINTQVLIFEMLSRLSPKGSIQKETLKDVGKMLKEKTGVQGIDVNDCLKILFEAAGYSELLEDDDLFNHITLQDALADVEGDDDLSDKMSLEEKKDAGESKGDKGKDKDDPKAKDYEDGGDRKGDKSKTKKGKKDYEDDDDDDKDDDDEMDETTQQSPKASISKADYLEALTNLQSVLKDLDNSSDEENSDIQEDDDKDDKDDDDDDDDNGSDEYEKAKEENGKRDRKYRKKVKDEVAAKAAKKEKNREGPKELDEYDGQA